MDAKIIFIFLISSLFFSQASFAKKAKNTLKNKPGVVQKLNKQTNDELGKNEDVQNCYLRAKAGQEKQHGVIYIDIEVGMHSEVITTALNKGQTTLSPEVGMCVVEALKNVIIPFRSSERSKKITAVFRF